MSQQAKPDAGLLRFLVHEVLIARDPGDAKVVEPQLALDGISVGFGQREVLVGATASFSSGVHVLFGVNGAGKSTLFRAVAGLVKASSGSVTYQGRDVASSPWRPRYLAQLGLMPQALPGSVQLSVAEVLRHSAWLKGLDPVQVETATDDVSRLCGLESLLSRKVEKLSGGERRLVMLAMAIVHRPSVVLLDEPTANLDLTQREALMGVIREVAPGRIVIVSTHLLEDILDLQPTVHLMREGRVHTLGSVNDVIAGQSVGPSLDRLSALREALRSYIASV